MKIVKIGNLSYCKRDRETERVYSIGGLSPTLNTCGGGNRMPKIVMSCASRQRGVPPNTYHKIEMGGKVSNCLTRVDTDYMICKFKKVKGHWELIPKVEFEGHWVAIRKLTPYECLRLMGVNEENIDKVRESGISKTHIYKAAGNSIVVHNLYHIFKQLYYPKVQRGEQLKLF